MDYSDLFLVALALIPLLLLVSFVQTYSTSRLNHLPGTWYSKFTSLPLTYHTVTGNQIHYIHRLHQQYGPVIRISPTQVNVADAKAFQEIHKIGSGFVKSPWYRKFRTPDPAGSIDVFSSIDPRMHAAKRRVLARPFSNSSLRQNWEDMVINKVRTTVAQIKKECTSKGSADILKWFNFMATDMIGLVAFDENFGLVETGEKPPFVNDLDVTMIIGGVRAELPMLWNVFRVLTLGLWNPLQGPDDRTRARSTKIMANLKSRKLSKGNIFFGVQAAEEESNHHPHDVAYAAYEGQSLMVAGSGTTAVTLTYLVWAVLKHSDVLSKLQAEVNGLDDGYRDVDLEDLPYLTAVVQETLRLYGAAPGNLPRVNYSAPLHVDGYEVPAGTTVNTQAWTPHRDPQVFRDPQSFDPERWLRPTAEMKTAFSPFGAGSRVCMGIHLATMELRHATAHFFREMTNVELSHAMKDEIMDVLHYFLITPKGAKCEVSL